MGRNRRIECCKSRLVRHAHISLFGVDSHILRHFVSTASSQALPVLPPFLGRCIIAASLALLLWNEVSSALRANDLASSGQPIPTIDPAHPDPAFDRQTVQLRGALQADSPAADPVLGPIPNAAFLRRSVEMYQWKTAGRRSTSRTGYDLSWSNTHVNLEAPPEFTNPPLPLRSGSFSANGLRLGAFLIAEPPGELQALPITPELLQQVAAAFPKSRPVVSNGWIQLDSPPVAGTLRFKFEYIPLGPHTVVAIQRGNSLHPLAAAPGTADPERLRADAASSSNFLLWAVRAFGAGLLFLGIRLLAKSRPGPCLR